MQPQLLVGILVVLTLWVAVLAGQATHCVPPTVKTVHVSLANAGGKQLECTFNRCDAAQLAQARSCVLDFLDQSPPAPDSIPNQSGPAGSRLGR